MINKFLFLIVVFITNIVQCITGFAGTVLAMPFSVILIGLSSARAILNVLGIAASAGVLFSAYKYVNKREFIKMTCFLLPGIIAGYFMSPLLIAYQKAAYIILGIVVIFFALLNFAKLFKEKEEREPNPVICTAILLASGLIHGVFVCGGPLLVTYASRKLKDSQEFRATLSAVWIILNGLILFSDIRTGCFDSGTLLLLGISLAILIGAAALGNMIAKKMSRKVFLILSYVLMIVSGISLFLKA